MQNPDIIHVGVLFFRRISCHGLTSLCGSNLAVFHSFRGGLLAKRSVCAQTTAQNRQRADIKLPAIKPVASACYTLLSTAPNLFFSALTMRLRIVSASLSVSVRSAA